MARNAAKKRWIKAIVLTVGVADCVGLYYAQQRLSTPVPDAIRYDRTAIMVPEEHNMFRAGAPAGLALASANATSQAIPAAPVAAPAAAQMARADRAPAPAAKAAPVAASRLAAAVPAVPVVKSVPASRPRTVVTPHLARVEAPAAQFPAASATLAEVRHTAALVAPRAAPEAKVARARSQAASEAPSSRLAGLVPKARRHSEFAKAFAAFEAPASAAVPLELALPGEPARVAAPAADFAASAVPLLEVPLPPPAVELPPVTATAETPEAKL